MTDRLLRAFVEHAVGQGAPLADAELTALQDAGYVDIDATYGHHFLTDAGEARFCELVPEASAGGNAPAQSARGQDASDQPTCIYCMERIQEDDYLAAYDRGDGFAHCGNCAIEHGIVPSFINRVPPLPERQDRLAAALETLIIEVRRNTGAQMALLEQQTRIADALERRQGDPDAWEYTAIPDEMTDGLTFQKYAKVKGWQFVGADWDDETFGIFRRPRQEETGARRVPADFNWDAAYHPTRPDVAGYYDDMEEDAS